MDKREIVDSVLGGSDEYLKIPVVLKPYTHSCIYLVIKINLKKHQLYPFFLWLLNSLILCIVNKIDSFNILQSSLEITIILNNSFD